MDFGGLKKFKQWAEYMFDHTMLIAEDDPYLDMFTDLANIGEIKEKNITALADLRIVPAVGCEKFAEMAYIKMSQIIEEMKQNPDVIVNGNVRVKSVEVFEHGANSAIYEG
jgi:6-pyruvoyltetrahydropterin/6-carboxytetrahydropterin synthase